MTTILIGGLILLGPVLILWALFKEPLVTLSVATGWALFALYLNWIA